MSRMLVRTLLVVGLLAGHTAPALIGTASAPDTKEPVTTCESAPAPDDGDVRIGTALLTGRGEAAARVAADCDGTVTSR